jgi:glycosyltransferase involved in cell wall biosynthesis
VRIALIAPPWAPVPPLSYGGTESVVDRLARGFQDEGHEVLLFTTGDSRCPVPRQWVYARAAGDQIGAAVVELRHLIHAYEAVRGFDIIHDHTVVGPVYSETAGTQCVVTTNHGPFDTDLDDVYRAVAGRVAIIAISHHQAGTAPADIPIAAVIHHGVDPEAFPFGHGDGGYFAFIGRMNPGKGVREAALVAREAAVPLRIAAKMREPWEHEYFEDQVRPLLTDDIVYLGEVGDGEKLELLAGAAALLNPLDWPEPFGLVMVEALACGTPVLAIPRGAAPEIVDDGVTGFLCPGLDEMASRITEVGRLDRKACRLAVETHFSTKRMVAAHLALFESLLLRKAG